MEELSSKSLSLRPCPSQLTFLILMIAHWVCGTFASPLVSSSRQLSPELRHAARPYTDLPFPSSPFFHTGGVRVLLFGQLRIVQPDLDRHLGAVASPQLQQLSPRWNLSSEGNGRITAAAPTHDRSKPPSTIRCALTPETCGSSTRPPSTRSGPPLRSCITVSRLSQICHLSLSVRQVYAGLTSPLPRLLVWLRPASGMDHAYRRGTPLFPLVSFLTSCQLFVFASRFSLLTRNRASHVHSAGNGASCFTIEEKLFVSFVMMLGGFVQVGRSIYLIRPSCLSVAASGGMPCPLANTHTRVDTQHPRRPSSSETCRSSSRRARGRLRSACNRRSRPGSPTSHPPCPWMPLLR